MPSVNAGSLSAFEATIAEREHQRVVLLIAPGAVSWEDLQTAQRVSAHALMLDIRLQVVTPDESRRASSPPLALKSSPRIVSARMLGSWPIRLNTPQALLWPIRSNLPTCVQPSPPARGSAPPTESTPRTFRRSAANPVAAALLFHHRRG